MQIRKSQLKEIIREVVVDLYVDETLKEKKGKWIQGAIKKPGALRKQMGVKKGEKIPIADIDKKISTLHKKGEGDKKLTKPERTELARLNLAKTLRKMKK